MNSITQASGFVNWTNLQSGHHRWQGTFAVFSPSQLILVFPKVRWYDLSSLLGLQNTASPPITLS